MGSICDGAACLGLSTSLNGNNCLTNEVQCKDGKLTVPSQGTVQQRFSASGYGGNATQNTAPLKIEAPNIGVQFPFTGPTDAAGVGPLLSVDITNPFCTTASVIFHCEFGWIYTASPTDQVDRMGVVRIASGTTTFVDTAPPFTTPTYPTQYDIGLQGSQPVFIAAETGLMGYSFHDSFTVLGTSPANDTFKFEQFGRLRLTAADANREINLFSVAVSILMSPTL